MNQSSSQQAQTAHSLPMRHFLLALLVVAIWGSNFVVARWGLDQFPPLLFATLRFFIAFLPALFIARPKVGWRPMAAYGVLIGLGQFGMLYMAMDGHITPGLASLVIQSQAFFTIGLAMWFSRERLRFVQIIALLLAAGGIAIILLHTDGKTTALGLGMILIGAMSWAGGNQVARIGGGPDALAFVIWSSLYSIPPLLALSLLIEGPQAIGRAMMAADLWGWGAVMWQSIGNTLFGYAAWAWLLARYPAATVSPMSLLVPIFGMSASALLLAEPLQDWKLGAAALVMSGLALNMLWPLIARLPFRPRRS